MGVDAETLVSFRSRPRTRAARGAGPCGTPAAPRDVARPAPGIHALRKKICLSIVHRSGLNREKSLGGLGTGLRCLSHRGGTVTGPACPQGLGVFGQTVV